MPLVGGRFRGTLYRAPNPVYARDPLSGRGAETYGGRFNKMGMPALYTSTDPATALREASQAGSLQPTVLVSYRADVGPIFDTRAAIELASYGVSAKTLADPAWRIAMLEGRLVPTQDLASELLGRRFAGLLTRSFAKGASEANLNLVLWRWEGAGCSLNVVDDEGRLARM